MTYFGILALFIGPPLLALALLTVYDARRGLPLVRAGLHAKPAIAVLLGHVAIALLYTTPWDNYLVATEVWWYDPALVSGLTLGWVPIEEYTFFVVQTLAVGLWLMALSRHVFRRARPLAASPALRRTSTLALGAIWLVAVLLWAFGGADWTYLGLILGWALPAIMLQTLFGADILWQRRGLLLTAIGTATLYLCALDTVAIDAGTWTIDPAQSTHVLLGGVLPVEEAIFFLLTTVLVVFGITLMLAEESYVRRRILFDAARARLQRPPAQTSTRAPRSERG